MKIENNTIVSLAFELRESTFEGRIIESVNDANPFTFLFGSGTMLPFFESNILSLKEGDNFKFTLYPNEAYGDKREEMIIDIPISVFEEEGKLNEEICIVGNEVPMVDVSGNKITGIIVEITDTFIKMDFNHPMAGVNLFFSGKIIDIRYPTGDEVKTGLNSCPGCSNSSQSNCCTSCK